MVNILNPTCEYFLRASSEEAADEAYRCAAGELAGFARCVKSLTLDAGTGRIWRFVEDNLVWRDGVDHATTADEVWLVET